MSKVRVAVRVRPPSAREQREGSACVISMEKNGTTVVNPEYLRRRGDGPQDPEERKAWYVAVYTPVWVFRTDVFRVCE